MRFLEFKHNLFEVGADNIVSKSGKTYELNSAYAFLKINNIMLFGFDKSHFQLKYLVQGAFDKHPNNTQKALEELERSGVISSSLHEKDLSKIKAYSKHEYKGRYFPRFKVLAFWESSEEFPKKRIDEVFEDLSYLFPKIQQKKHLFRFQFGDTDNITIDQLPTYEDLFINKKAQKSIPMDKAQALARLHTIAGAGKYKKAFRKSNEAYHGTFKNTWADKLYTVFKNPKGTEWSKLWDQYGTSRGLVDAKTGDIYVWKLSSELHKNVSKELKINDCIAIVLYKNDGVMVTDGTSKKYIRSSQVVDILRKSELKSVFGSKDFAIYYFDQDIEGEW